MHTNSQKHIIVLVNKYSIILHYGIRKSRTRTTYVLVRRTYVLAAARELDGADRRRVRRSGRDATRRLQLQRLRLKHQQLKARHAHCLKHQQLKDTIDVHTKHHPDKIDTDMTCTLYMYTRTCKYERSTTLWLILHFKISAVS